MSAFFFGNKLLVYKIQSIHPKQNQKQITHDSNKLYMLQTGRKSHYHFMRSFTVV